MNGSTGPGVMLGLLAVFVVVALTLVTWIWFGARVREPDREEATVRGTVTGTDGLLWGARVVAVRGALEVESWTDTEGRYELIVDAPFHGEIHVRPDPETHLVPAVRPLSLAAGESLTGDFALLEAPKVSGQIVDVSGDGVERVRVMAIGRETADAITANEVAHLASLRDSETRHAWTDSRGRFSLYYVPQGEYRLMIDSQRWMCAKATYLRAGTRKLAVTAIPTLGFDVRVHDLETGQPIRAFEIRAELGLGAPEVVLEADNGELARRVPWPPPHDRLPPAGRPARISVHAKGYLPAPQPQWPTPFVPRRVRLQRARPPNTKLTVRYDDGRPYAGDVYVSFHMPRHRPGTSVKAEEVSPGYYRFALPQGRWVLWPRLESLIFPHIERLTVDVGVSGVGRKLIVWLPAGGTMVIRRPQGWKGAFYPLHVRHELDDVRVRTRVVPLGADPWRVEGVAPGTYSFGHAKGRTVVWTRTVTMDAGDEVEIAMPLDE